MNLHFHVVFLEGVYLDRSAAGLKPRFVKAEPPSEALNHALSGIPPDRVRLHLGWDNYEGPHHAPRTVCWRGGS